MSDSQLQRTPLAACHEELKAQMVDFAGWYLPLNYTSVIQEHLHTRNKASLFDTSHMGEIEIRGPHAFGFLQHLLTFDLHKLPPLHCHYTLMCNYAGGTIDDCFVYCFNTNRYWLVVNASNTAKDLSWLRKHASYYSVVIHDLSARKAKLDIQGPLSEEILQRLTAFPLKLLNRFDFVETRLLTYVAVISRSGYTAEDGFEIYLDAENSLSVWNYLLASDCRLKPAGLAARDSLRLEACYPLYGHELTEDITPLEAGLSWVVDLKEEDYIGKKALLAQKANGLRRRLIAFKLKNRSLPRQGMPISFKDQPCGVVTSGGFSPILNCPIGLGLCESLILEPGHVIQIEIRNKACEALVYKRPFYKYNFLQEKG